jgi:hypothetical protein
MLKANSVNSGKDKDSDKSDNKLILPMGALPTTKDML